jgi:anti-sigma factor RsiW
MTNNVRHPDEFLLHEYLDGELTEAAGRELEAHLAACPACQARLDELTRLFTLLDVVPELTLSADLSRLILEKLRPETGRLVWPGRLPSWAQLALAGQIALALLMLALLWPLASPLLPTTDVTLTDSLNAWLDGLSLAPAESWLAETAAGAGQWLETLEPALLIPAGSWLLVVALALLAWLAGNSLLLKRNWRLEIRD